MSFTLGQQVFFGRTAGEKTRGTILKINGASIKVRQDEARGGKPVGTEWRVHPSLVYPCDGTATTATTASTASTASTVTTATTATTAPAPRLPQQPEHAVPAWKSGDRVSFDAGDKMVTGTITRCNRKTVTVENCDDGTRGYRVSPTMLRAASGSAPKRSEDDVMRDIFNQYVGLSPENLSADGERSRSEVSRRRTAIYRRLIGLQFELGREVSEDQAWAWYAQQSRSASA